MTDVRFHRCKRWMLTAMAVATVAAIGVPPASTAEPSRILSAGGAVTEILYELGVADRIVAVDSTSLYPPEALKTHKNVGYFRALSTEGVLSVAPDLIIASDKAGPPEVVRALKSSGIEYFEINDEPSPEALTARVKAIAGKVGKAAAGEELVKRIEKGFADLAAATKGLTRTPSALFVLSVQGGRATIGGTDTTADVMLKLAGATNAASTLKGFKPISEESIIAMDPEAIVIMSRSGGHGVGSEVLKLPGVAATRAGRDRRVIEMDGLYLMGFGPRAPEAATDLMKALQKPAQVPDGAAAPKTPGSKG
jgi:iron complex transport system substrate-binding protein